MFSFLLGLAAGAAAMLNGREIRRGVAKAALAGGDAAVALGQHARRLSAVAVEDMQDAYAEAKAERAASVQSDAGAENFSSLYDELHALRDEIQSMASTSTAESAPESVQ